MKHHLLIIGLFGVIAFIGYARVWVERRYGPEALKQRRTVANEILTVYFRDRSHGSAEEIARYLDYPVDIVEQALVELGGRVHVQPNSYGSPTWHRNAI